MKSNNKENKRKGKKKEKLSVVQAIFIYKINIRNNEGFNLPTVDLLFRFTVFQRTWLD